MRHWILVIGNPPIRSRLPAGLWLIRVAENVHTVTTVPFGMEGAASFVSNILSRLVCTQIHAQVQWLTLSANISSVCRVGGDYLL